MISSDACHDGFLRAYVVMQSPVHSSYLPCRVIGPDDTRCLFADFRGACLLRLVLLAGRALASGYSSIQRRDDAPSQP
jgi:hypothetical protein